MQVILRKNNYLEAIEEKLAEITNDKQKEMNGNAITDLYFVMISKLLRAIKIGIL